MLRTFLTPVVLVPLLIASPAPAAWSPDDDAPTSASPAGSIGEQEQLGHQDPNVTEVQDGVESSSEATERDLMQKIIDESVVALEESHEALRALTDGDTERALAALERAVGKLELILRRSPDMALAPVGVETTVYDLYLDGASIEQAIRRARRLLSEGKVQDARVILDTLRSEVVHTTSYLPMGTFPDAIADVAPFIDRGEIDEAARMLRATLGTLVVIDRVTPLPLLRAELLLDEGKALAETADRTDEQSERLSDLLDSTRKQLRMGDLLGYGDREDFKPLYKEIEGIREKTHNDGSGTGFFDVLRDGITSLRTKFAI